MKTSNISQRLKEIMEDENLRQVDILNKSKPFTEKLGIKLNKNDLSQYVSGKVEPNQDKLTLLSLTLNVSEPWLMGYDVQKERVSYKEIKDIPNIIPLNKVYKIPILGKIACGDPILAEENLEGYVMADFIEADFAIRATGDSMIDAEIYEGDYCFIRQQPQVENGEIAAVLLGDEATLKRVYKDKKQIILQPENKNYSPIVLTDDIKILGKLVGIYHKV